ncbi:hypothetical protein [Rhizobium sp.]|uniref:hypothetical protein n=1 Tax=Rhizobium sp. TaxID=391 RepID=UPI000DDDD68E
MGEVIQFRPATRYGKLLDAQARMERELQLPLATAEQPTQKATRANPPDTSTVPKSKIGLPISGIVIVVGSILVYALVISHVVGQPHYSARANLMPSIFLQN